MASELRKRNSEKKSETELKEVYDKIDTVHTVTSHNELQPGSYWLTRILLLRFISFIFVVAFLVALHQNKALIGKSGILPADQYLNNVKTRLQGSNWERFQKLPTLLWFLNYEDNLDSILDNLAYAGLLLSGFVLLNGGANMFIMLAIWLIYHSIVNVGQRWYSFGWESQILETGFIAIFLCPLLSVRSVPRGTPTSFIAILAFRWLIIRIMIGAGLIKIRGDQCWRDLTCMNYHYETQPVPNPMAYYMHQSPENFHKFETLSNHFVELVVPFFIVLNRRMRLIGGFLQVLFQAVLIVSGNLSFLNWLTMIPAFACFDDKSIAWMYSSKRLNDKWKVCQIQKEEKDQRFEFKKSQYSKYSRTLLNMVFGGLIVYLSIPIVQNLMSSRQIMNTSFDSMRIVNTYGAFGSITKDRTEVIFQGTYALDPNDPKAKWEDYEFKCKPGSVDRRPCLISPYHYRLDWLMWFAAFQNPQYTEWLLPLAAKFLENDEAVTQLIAHNPFQGKEPPRFVRAEHYRYVYTKVGSKEAREGKWWKRSRIKEYLPVVNLERLGRKTNKRNKRKKRV